ncbi:MAG: molybdate ABC transporter substrate-binding protein [Deltaproteobacteria bacterium]|nr:molybdate ABC transporter substrate-binding protein [Deltaproteobacteria bacterium]
MDNLLYTLIAALIFFCFCAPAALADGGKRLTVAAASDLTFALKEIALGFEKDTGDEVVISFGSSGIFARQIESGAPFDVFFSADMRYMDDLEKGGYIIPSTVTPYARGVIVLAVNRRSGEEAVGLKDLLRPGIKKIAIANPAHAPYGKAAVEALKGAGVFEAVKEKLVYGENIRQALQFIQTGDAQAGVVALSIASVPEVSYTPIDPGLHNPIDQAAGVVKSTKEPSAALSFIRYAVGDRGRAIFKKYGFIVP